MASSNFRNLAQTVIAEAASQGRSTDNSASDHYLHFLKCLRLWEAMLPRKAGDEVSGELMAKGYYRMLGSLSAQQINQLSELVLNECKWFPTVAECRELMGRKSYSNPFFVQSRTKELAALGYGEDVAQIAAPAKQIGHADGI